MSTEQRPETDLLGQVQQELQKDVEATASKIKMGIYARSALIVFVALYMTWMLGALSQLDADEITRLAATTIEEQLPDLRLRLRNYAIEKAPEVTDQAQDMLMGLPARAGGYLEAQLQQTTTELVQRLENDVDLALSTVIEDQINLVRAEFPGVSPEEQLDTIVFGFSEVFRQTMIDSLDEMYEHYTVGVRRLDGHLEHLQAASSLTDAEQIDKELIEAWIVLVHAHRVTSPERVADALQASF